MSCVLWTFAVRCLSLTTHPSGTAVSSAGGALASRWEMRGTSLCFPAEDLEAVRQRWLRECLQGEPGESIWSTESRDLVP